MSVKVDDKVRLKRDISRVEGPYAKAGDMGVVEELFKGFGKTLYAKVRMSDGEGYKPLKTFRLTSLEVVGTES